MPNSGFAGFLFPAPNRTPESKGLRELVNPAILGLEEKTYKWVVVEQVGDSVRYTGILHSGGQVSLSPISGQRQLLEIASMQQDVVEVPVTDVQSNGPYPAYRTPTGTNAYKTAKKYLAKQITLMVLCGIVATTGSTMYIFTNFSEVAGGEIIPVSKWIVSVVLLTLSLGAVFVSHRAIRRLSIV
jgi:hypothetical protein